MRGSAQRRVLAMLSDDMTDQDRIDMLAAALADYRRAFANDGKTSSLADWQRRMKAADTSAAAVLLRCVGADPLAG
jgi:hypothetical protein